MTIERRSGTLERPDCTIHYEVAGTGKAIIFAHGLGGNYLSWFQQVAHFAPHHACITFSHRGFARSSPIAGGPDPAQYAGDLAALVEHLNLTDLRIVAQSMGGWSAIEYALTQPQGLKALVLACTTGTIDLKQMEDPERQRLPEWYRDEFSKAPALFARGIHPACGTRMAQEQPAQHLLYRQIDELNGELDRTLLGAKLMAMRTRNPKELNAVDCPILFVAGDEDIVIPPFAGDAIARVVPRAGVAHIQRAGHSTYFERPAEFNRVVSEFLAAT